LANAYGISVKPFHHHVDLTYLKVGGVSVNRGSQYQNIQINEQLKKMTDDELRVHGQLMNLYWDNAKSYQIVGDQCIEENNTIVITPIENGPIPTRFANDAHIKRAENINKFTRPNLTYADSKTPYEQIIGNDTTKITILETGINQINEKFFTIQYLAYIPLIYLNDFFRKMPTVSSLTGFDLKLQLNISLPKPNFTKFAFRLFDLSNQPRIFSASTHSTVAFKPPPSPMIVFI